MKRTNKCPKCGSNDIIADARAIGHAETELAVAMFRKPEAVIFKGQIMTTVSAWVCAACGFVELYADSPHSIKVGGVEQR